MPAPDAARIRGTSVPASMAATIGRPAARIEYVFDGTLTRARPRAQRHGVHVTGGQQLAEALVGHEAGEAHVRQARRPPLEVRGERPRRR